MKVYLDNAATSYPKPQTVYNSVLNYMTNIGSNIGRGGYSHALQGNRLIYNCRETISNFFNFDKPENVIFTSNITASLNILIKSIVKDGWHVITTSMEHNSVLRPLNSLHQSGKIELDIIECNAQGFLDVEVFRKNIKKNTKLVVMSHSSNVIGSIQPIEKIGNICKEYNIYFIIDTAQTAGVLPIDFYKVNCSALAFTGHKSLLGPQGIGGFVISDSLNEIAVPFIEGGTGSLSESILQPNILPDKFESGTMNAPAIAGLLEGIKFINSEGLQTIFERESHLTNLFINEMRNMKDIIVYGSLEQNSRTSAISINSTKIDNSEFGFILDNEYGIMTRTGLHCAPLAHRTIGTFPQGTLRFSFGAFNDENDVNYAVSAINSIIKRKV